MSDDVTKLREHVDRTLGEPATTWPGGWPCEIEAALIDAVFSIRANYGSRARKTGVYGAVSRYRDTRPEGADDLRKLASMAEEELEALTNRGRTGGRSKAGAVIDAANALVEAGVVHASDLKSQQAVARSAYLSVRGCGPVTWSYLCMLLGIDDVKADTWVMRFVQQAVPHAKTTEEVRRLVSEVAKQMGVRRSDLDHAIWSYQRSLRDGAS